MTSKSKPSPEGLPHWPEIGQLFGHGQDNRVYQLVGPAEKPHLRPPVGAVLKINHASQKQEVRRHHDSREAAWRGIQYKKNKYELLKLFLNDYVPDSLFVLGQVSNGKTKRYAEMTYQTEVPRVSLSDLTPDQRADPKLEGHVVDLMRRLKYMYTVLGETNARTAQGVTLDGKLDLGGVSDYVRTERIDYGFQPKDAQAVIQANKSPNLLVNPETLDLYCVDFDQGQWTPGMSEAKAMAEQIVADDNARYLANLALGHHAQAS